MSWTLTLRVGDTSAQDIVLTAAPVGVMDYAINAPDLNQEAIQSLGDGNSLSVPSFSNVTESIDLHIQDSTAALVQTKVQAIERLLDLARQGSLGQYDDRLYLRIQFDNDTYAWRSQILAARFSSDEGTNQIWKNYVRGTLIITRRYYWEAETMQSVAVESSATAATTGYATVYNSDDTLGPDRNLFAIAGSSVTGSLPAPAKIYIKNISGATRAAATIFLGNYVFANSDDIRPIFRGSTATASDTTPADEEQNIYTWSLAANTLADDMKGQFGRFVVVWSDRPASTTLVRAAVKYYAPAPDIDLALGEQMLTESLYVTDLGALPIPPSGWTSGMGASLAVALKAKAASGSDTLGVDWLQIFPSGVGRYRVLTGIAGSMSLSSNEQIVDDGPNGVVYALTTGGDPLPIYRPFYSPIHLWPGRAQHFRIIISSGLSSFEPDEEWGIRVEYRPRRVTF